MKIMMNDSMISSTLPSFRSFLTQTRVKNNDYNIPKVAGDTDSTVSALGLDYAKHHYLSKYNNHIVLDPNVALYESQGRQRQQNEIKMTSNF